jgi:putative (di)nucleoside polyphosphate hydrolase
MADQSEKRYRPNVAIIVTDGHGNVLMGRRANHVATYDPVQVVQGGIDAGETPDQAAARELREELGILDKDFEMIGKTVETYRYDWPEDYRKTRKDNLIGQEQRFFLARMSQDIRFNLDAYQREFSKVWWGSPQELVRDAWEAKRPGIEAALRYFKLI